MEFWRDALTRLRELFHDLGRSHLGVPTLEAAGGSRSSARPRPTGSSRCSRATRASGCSSRSAAPSTAGCSGAPSRLLGARMRLPPRGPGSPGPPRRAPACAAASRSTSATRGSSSSSWTPISRGRTPARHLRRSGRPEPSSSGRAIDRRTGPPLAVPGLSRWRTASGRHRGARCGTRGRRCRSGAGSGLPRRRRVPRVPQDALARRAQALAGDRRAWISATRSRTTPPRERAGAGATPQHFADCSPASPPASASGAGA